MAEAHRHDWEGARLLTSVQAAEYLGFTAGWLAKLRVQGGGPKWIRLGRKARYTIADLESWIGEHRVSSTSAG
jgi:hypothetical protein